MVVQEFIEWDHYVRCMCLGQEEVLPIKYNPHERRYYVEHEHLSPELGQRIVWKIHSNWFAPSAMT